MKMTEVSFLMALLNELGHGLVATLVGLEFRSFYASVFGSSGAWINGSRFPFQSVVISSAGPMVDLVIGLIAFFIILPRVKKWSARLFYFLAATTTLICFWGLMMSTVFGTGDFEEFSNEVCASQGRFVVCFWYWAWIARIFPLVLRNLYIGVKK